MKLFNTVGIASAGLFATAVFLGLFTATTYAATSPSLGAADNFSVLAGSEITNIPTSVINRNVGLSPYPGGNYSGLTASEVGGTIFAVDNAGPAGSVMNPSLLLTALANAHAAFNAIASQTCTTTYSGAKDLVGLSLVPGVYCADAFSLTGTLTLAGTANDVWIFKSASSVITTGSTANILFDGSGQACNVWWSAVSSASFDTSSKFTGNVLADTSISFASGVTLNGRALARTGAVTLSATTITSTTCAVPGLPKTDLVSGSVPSEQVNMTWLILTVPAIALILAVFYIVKNKTSLRLNGEK
jgi:hypothetical protein